MSDSEQIKIEVAFALRNEQALIALNVAEETTLEQAVEQSGIQSQFPDFDFTQFKFGIFGKIKPATTILRAGDRVEIYRPLIADPKEVRRKRAEAGKGMKKGVGSEKT